MRNIKALHIASFMGNVGDNANHNGLRNKLKNIFYNNNIIFDELEMREFYQSWNLRNFNSEEFINLANKYDLIIIGGGNFFELKWDYSCTGTTVNMSIETLDKISTPILFFGLGCDIAKGASHDATSKFDKFLEYLTSSHKYLVTVRNDGSYKTINKLYGNKYDNKVHRVIDGGFFVKTKTPYLPGINNTKFIGLNIVSDMKEIRFNDNITFEQFIKNMASVINKFLKEYNEYKIILFPHIYSDLEAIYKLVNEIEDIYRRTRIIVAPYLAGKGSEEYIFGLYKKCDVILGMRFHSNVCAIAQDIPTIALSSYKKINDLYLELNLEERVVNVNVEGFDKILYRELINTLQNIDNIIENYSRINKEIEEEFQNFIEIFNKWAKINKLL